MYLQSNITIAGDFTVSGTGPLILLIMLLIMSNTPTGYTINVNGNLIVNNDACFKMNNGIGSCIVNVDGNFFLNSGNYTIVTGGANSTVNVAGNVDISGGTLLMNEDPSLNNGILNVIGSFTQSDGTIDMTTSTGTGTINLTGNFDMSGGTIDRTGSNQASAFVFVGDTRHTFTRTGATIPVATADVDFIVTSSDIIDFGATDYVDGLGTFQLDAGATIETENQYAIGSPGIRRICTMCNKRFIYFGKLCV